MSFKYKTVFRVEGTGEFAFDMLRYDRCYCHGSIDTVEMLSSDQMTPRKVTLVKFHENKPRSQHDFNEYGLTPDRWRSFGWKILDIVETTKLA